MLPDSRRSTCQTGVIRFSDFAESAKILDGPKIKLDDVVNIEVTVLGFRVSQSKYAKNKSGKCLTIQIEVNGEHRVVFTGSDVLLDQMEQYGNRVPFVATIRKIDRYYTLS